MDHVTIANVDDMINAKRKAYGRTYRVLEALSFHFEELIEELGFNGVVFDGDEDDGHVELTLDWNPVAVATMSDRHADARLQVDLDV